MSPARIVAIAGAGGGLGPTVVRAFAAQGASLALAGRDAGKLDALLDSLGVPAQRRMTSAVDLLDEAAAVAWAAEITSRFGAVDTVLHLVGGYKGGATLAGITAADWNGLQAMLVTTALNVVRAFVEPLKASGRGRFVAVTSPKARAPSARSALYAMAKAAADALVLALADEMRGTGSTANLVEVDSIDVPGAAGPAKPYGKTTPAEQIASAMLYLCSEEAATINGIRLPLTGRG